MEMITMLQFTKMQGLGNDYIYFDCVNGALPKNPEALSIKLSDRHFGVGSDGIVLIMPSDKADFRMRMFNADGSEGAMCGNASRCIAKYVFDIGLTDKTDITLETKSGVKRLMIKENNGAAESVTVDMGAPKVGAVSEPISTDLASYTYTFVDMGNPHCVIFIDEDIAGLDIEKVGKPLENHEFFPDRANVEFVNIKGGQDLNMRVWERGSGETLACGTGACAVVAAACENGYAKRGTPVRVHLKGGTLEITYTDEAILMTGGAEFVFSGEVEE